MAEWEIRKELIPPWAERPIDDITRRDVLLLIEAIRDRPAPYYAHTIFAYARRIFNFAINLDRLEASPCDRVRPAKFIGAKQPRQRVLSDTEIRAFWRATERLELPAWPFIPDAVADRTTKVRSQRGILDRD